MNRIIQLTLLSLVWMCSTAATATVITVVDFKPIHTAFSVIKSEHLGEFSGDWLDSQKPVLNKVALQQMRKRGKRLLPSPVVTPHPVVGPVKPAAAVAEPGIFGLMALGFGVLVLLRGRLSRMNDAALNPAS